MQAMMDVLIGLTTLDTVKNRRWAMLGQQSPAPQQPTLIIIYTIKDMNHKASTVCLESLIILALALGQFHFNKVTVGKSSKIRYCSPAQDWPTIP